MAGFRVSVGDSITVGTFAWNIYRACKNASVEFEEVGREGISLHVAAKELEEEAANPDSILSRGNERKKTGLASIPQHCRAVLSQLEGLLTKYKSLGTKHKKKWDAIGYALRAWPIPGARSRFIPVPSNSL